jgi:hypothetical protein
MICDSEALSENYCLTAIIGVILSFTYLICVHHNNLSCLELGQNKWGKSKIMEPNIYGRRAVL